MAESNKQVTEAWSEKVGRHINFELREVKTHDGREQTLLINPETGSIVVAVNATGRDAADRLVRQAGDTFIDPAFSQDEIDGPQQVNHVATKGDNPTDGGTPASTTQGVVPQPGPGERGSDSASDEEAEAEKTRKADEAKAAKAKEAADAKKAATGGGTGA